MTYVILMKKQGIGSIPLNAITTENGKALLTESNDYIIYE